ncbi:MAG: hypothetical protein KME17_06155 [Cyanosarcina radialis HA8281-LM2]|jgi:hypothetical protein|nr:hypothetical protein [Cyanosarcina radialis HA8281-LM2]
MIHRDRLIQCLNSISWRDRAVITSEAFSLIEEHIEKMRYVIPRIMARQNLNEDEAHGFAQAAGSDSLEYGDLLDKLFADADFAGAGIRHSLIASIAAGYCWHLDPELNDLPNPWIPFLALIEMGYTVTTDASLEGDEVFLLVGYKNGIARFLII